MSEGNVLISLIFNIKLLRAREWFEGLTTKFYVNFIQVVSFK